MHARTFPGCRSKRLCGRAWESSWGLTQILSIAQVSVTLGIIKNRNVQLGVRTARSLHIGLCRMVCSGVPLAVPIGLSPLLILTLCGSERVLVVSTGGGGGMDKTEFIRRQSPTASCSFQLIRGATLTAA